MKTKLEDCSLDTRIEASDWRYSASIVGLCLYFVFHNIEYKMIDDYIEFNNCDITEEKYLLFAEEHFKDKMHHRLVESALEQDAYSEEQIKFINSKLVANTIMKKHFKDIKFTGEEENNILSIIKENRLELVKETYKNGNSLYKKFANINKLLSDSDEICRLLGYYVDIGKKSKSISYNQNYKTYLSIDDSIFDFIPFAFSKSNDSFFINNNFSVEQLLATNRETIGCENVRKKLFENVEKSSQFIDYDVEVIVVDYLDDPSKGFYYSLYIRKPALKIFRNISSKDYSGIEKNIKITDNYYINLEKEVTNYILNNTKLDKFIETLLKNRANYNYNIKCLIKINTLIYGGKNMDENMKNAYGCAKKVIAKINPNKVNSYQQKLISAIVFKEYDRFCEILIQLATYSEVDFRFAYDLFKNFEENKNIAYTFVNALNNKGEEKQNEQK